MWKMLAGFQVTTGTQTLNNMLNVRLMIDIELRFQLILYLR